MDSFRMSHYAFCFWLLIYRNDKNIFCMVCFWNHYCINPLISISDHQSLLRWLKFDLIKKRWKIDLRNTVLKVLNFKLFLTFLNEISLKIYSKCDYNTNRLYWYCNYHLKMNFRSMIYQKWCFKAKNDKLSGRVIEMIRFFCSEQELIKKMP